MNCLMLRRLLMVMVPWLALKRLPHRHHRRSQKRLLLVLPGLLSFRLCRELCFTSRLQLMMHLPRLHQLLTLSLIRGAGGHPRNLRQTDQLRRRRPRSGLGVPALVKQVLAGCLCLLNLDPENLSFTFVVSMYISTIYLS